MLLLYARQISALNTPQRWSTHEVRSKDTEGKKNCKFMHIGTFIYGARTVHRLEHTSRRFHLLVREIGPPQKVTVSVSGEMLGRIRANYDDFNFYHEVGEDEKVFVGAFASLFKEALVAADRGVTANQKVKRTYIGPDILIRNSSRY